MSAAVESRDRFLAAEDWARRNLPNEFPPFAASAAMTLSILDKPVTPEAVLERLRAQGRDSAARKDGE